MPSSSIMVMIHYFSRCTLYIFVHYLSNIRISKTSNDILAVLCVWTSYVKTRGFAYRIIGLPILLRAIGSNFETGICFACVQETAYKKGQLLKYAYQHVEACYFLLVCNSPGLLPSFACGMMFFSRSNQRRERRLCCTDNHSCPMKGISHPLGH